MVSTRRFPLSIVRLVILTLAVAVRLAGMAHAEPAIGPWVPSA